MTGKICICGAGTMGSGIAQLTASSAFPTTLYDVNIEVLERAKKTIDGNLKLLVEKNKITTDQREKIFKNISFTNDLNECVADLIIEAIIEDLEAKTRLFNELATINDNKAILASNTSSLPVSAIANEIPYPQRFLGMHFFNPAPLMKLVEIINTNHTNAQTTRAATDVARRLGKSPVVCKDSPGFIVNRVARPYYIESLRLVEEDKISLQSIDALLEASGFKLGPFKLMDLIGNDINYSVSCSIYEQLNKPERLRPSGIQKEKVEKGELGKKTGKGYYRYN